LYVLALLTGPMDFLIRSFVDFINGGFVDDASGPLTYLFPVTVLIGAVYMVRRSFRPGAERITLGNALIAAGLVPTGLALTDFAYILLPEVYRVDSYGNDLGGLLAFLGIIGTVPVIVPLVGVGLLVRRKERKAESLPVFLGVLGGAILLAAIVWLVLLFTAW